MADFNKIHYLKQNNLVVNSNNEFNIDDFLLNEQKINKNSTWAKLNKVHKVNKLNHFVNENLSETYELSECEIQEIKDYLKQRLERKKLTNNKEVLYDKDKQLITELPGFNFNKQTRKFTLKNLDKKANSSLKNLPNYKKIQNNIKSKNKIKPKKVQINKTSSPSQSIEEQ
jgi:hypothetical protein